MNYVEGVARMAALWDELTYEEQTEERYRYCRGFNVVNIRIEYPGKKLKRGDYRLRVNGYAPTHAVVVKEIYALTDTSNFYSVQCALEDVFLNGLYATTTFFSRSFIEKLYWITLQEEINYPYPKQGRKLTYQRLYEAALVKIWNADLTLVLERTNNHGGRIPKLWKVDNWINHVFYSLGDRF